MVGRITQSFVAQRTLRDLNASFARVANLQEQLSTGRRVNRPSDDPLDARRAISISTRIGKNDQFISNIQNVSPQLEGTGIALLNSVDILQRAQELAIQAANETVDIDSLQNIALEIDQLLEATVVEANRRINDRSIFAGTRTIADAFDVTRVGGEITAVTYAGNSNSIEVEIAESVRTAINEPGDDAFLGTVDIFQTLIALRDDIRAGDQDAVRNTGLPALEDGIEQLLLSSARIGSIQNRIERVENTTSAEQIELQAQFSERVEADFATTVLNFNVQQNALNAALGATARVIQPSLLDFLR